MRGRRETLLLLSWSCCPSLGDPRTGGIPTGTIDAARGHAQRRGRSPPAAGTDGRPARAVPSTDGASHGLGRQGIGVRGIPLVELLKAAGVKFGHDLRGPALADLPGRRGGGRLPCRLRPPRAGSRLHGPGDPPGSRAAIPEHAQG